MKHNTNTGDTDWLDEILVATSHLIDYVKDDTITVQEAMLMSPRLKEAKVAINQELVKARKEQIMQDFMSLNITFDGCVDEKNLINWREEQIAELETQLKEGK